MKNNMKLEALAAMAEGGDNPAPTKMEPHEATCPKCGHTWTMGEDEDEYEDED